MATKFLPYHCLQGKAGGNQQIDSKSIILANWGHVNDPEQGRGASWQSWR